MNLPEQVKKDLLVLSSAVDKAAESRVGTFSERNPILGRMVTCPFCRRRRRAKALTPCCNARYVVESKSFIPKIKARRNPRLTRHRPPLFLLRQLLLEVENSPAPMMTASVLQDDYEGQVHGPDSKWGHTPQETIKMEHLASFMEKVVIRKLKQKAKKKRDQQKRSRKINREC